MNVTESTSGSASTARDAETEAFIAARRPRAMPPAGSGASQPASDGESGFAATVADSERESAAQALRAPGVEVEEQRYRSVLKAISWRITGTLDTMLISYLVTGNLAAAASIGFLEVFTKMALYYGHERLWSRLKFGRRVKEIPPPDYQI
ncbi:MAG: DUF2061 domain-containing protein [Leptospirales bacterium]|jgi:uncharacterized membrane protein